MTITIPGLEQAPTQHVKLLAWVREYAELSQPDRVEWVDGSPAEWTRITDQLVGAGTFTRLNAATKPNSFWAASDPADVARVEDRTFICSLSKENAGPTNNWVNPFEMRRKLKELFAARWAAVPCMCCRSAWARSAGRCRRSECSLPIRPTSW